MKQKHYALMFFLMSATFLFAQEWTPLFNQEDLSGWKHVDSGGFIVNQGILETQGGMGLLFYEDQPFENVQLRVVYKNPEGKNAGVFIRIPEPPEDAWMPVNKGYEVQIDDRGDDYHCTGVLYSMNKAAARPSKPGQWNTMEITLDGPRTLVHINGVLVTDFTEGQEVPEKKIWYEPERGPRPVKGYIGLQNHGPEDVVYFKEVSYRPLDATIKKSHEKK